MNRVLNEIKNDLMTIEEGQHGYFRSRPYTESDDVIKLIDFIDENFDEVNPFEEGKNFEDFIFDDYLADEIEEYFDKCLNSSNWNGRVIFQIRCFKMNGIEYSAICFHRFGDARCNYTKYACFEMSHEEFLNRLYEFEIQIPCKNEDWRIFQNLFDEDGRISAYNYATDEEFSGWYEDSECPEEVRQAVADEM